MNVAMRRCVVLISGVAAALLLSGCGGFNKRDYVAQNEALFRSLPVYPDAAKLGEDTRGSKSSGYETVIYRVPRRTSGAAVLRFYELKLQERGWQQSGKSLEADFTRAKALVALYFSLEPAPPKLGKPSDRTYAVMVDYRGASRG
jgi:hypothetical protein